MNTELYEANKSVINQSLRNAVRIVTGGYYFDIQKDKLKEARAEVLDAAWESYYNNFSKIEVSDDDLQTIWETILDRRYEKMNS